MVGTVLGEEGEKMGGSEMWKQRKENKKNSKGKAGAGWRQSGYGPVALRSVLCPAPA